MKWLFFADTPLQVYHAALIVLDFEKEDSAELMICEQFADARGIGERMAQMHVFDAVHYCQAPKNSAQIRAMQLKAFLGISGFEFEAFGYQSFDVLALTTPTCINSSLLFSLRKGNPEIKVVFYDDGVGSYTGGIFRGIAYLGEIPKGVVPPVKWVRILRALFASTPFRKNRYSPTALYVRQPQLLGYSPLCPTYEINCEYSKAKMLSGVFAGSPNKVPRPGSVVFLDVARGVKDGESADCDVAIDSAIEHSFKLGIEAFLRSHPRSKKKSSWAEKCIDYSGGLWEILCEMNPIDDLVLVGLGSTAQISPALETASRPFLVFLYNLCFDEAEPRYRSYLTVENMARSLYGEDGAERIFSPKTNAELDETLSRLAKTRFAGLESD